MLRKLILLGFDIADFAIIKIGFHPMGDHTFFCLWQERISPLATILFLCSCKEKVSKKKARPNFALFPENTLICLTENG
ncbi:hypothetical protein [Lonepinella sp. BR2474]|uniref:hypothetical protein n=1 Tax=Lonepinella sp. BR2474 TaxID=3434548 RepID=UPI003F6DFD9F